MKLVLYNDYQLGAAVNYLEFGQRAAADMDAFSNGTRAGARGHNKEKHGGTRCS